MGDDMDDTAEEIVETEVDRRLEADDTGVFSKAEIMRRLRSVIRGSTEKEDALELYEDGTISRRKFLQLLGFGMGGAVVASSMGWFMGQKVFDERKTLPTGYVTLDISDGEVIDDYLDRHLEDGAEVHIPAGEYQWEGYGLRGRFNDLQLIGDGNVVWNVSDHIYESTIISTGGTVRLKDITIRGQRGAVSMDDNSRDANLAIAVRAEDPNGHVIIDNVNQPDGGVNGSDVIGHWVGPDHEGRLTVRNCHIEHFGNNGIYGGEYKDSGAQMTVEGCFLKNNNIDAIRIAGSDVVRSTVIVVDQPVPDHYDAAHGSSEPTSGRGIRPRYAGSNMQIQDVDIAMLGHGQYPIRIVNGTGSLSDVRIRNENDHDAIVQEHSREWEVQNLCITGDGNTGHPSYMDVTDSCTVQTSAPSAVDGDYTAPSEGSGGDGDGDGEEGGNGGSPC